MALPSVGSATQQAHLSMLGEQLRAIAPRADIPSLARFVSASIRSGRHLLNDNHLSLIDSGDSESGLRVAAHDAICNLGSQVVGSQATVFTEDTKNLLEMRLAGRSLSPREIAVLLRQGLNAGLYDTASLHDTFHQLGDDRENGLPPWCMQAIENHLKASGPFSGESSPIHLEFMSSEHDSHDNSPVDEPTPYLAWSLEEIVYHASFLLPADDSPESIQLRDILMMMCAATQMLAIEFTAPYEMTLDSGMLGFEVDEDAGFVQERLAGAPATSEAIYNLLAQTVDRHGDDVEQREVSFEALCDNFPSLPSYLEFEYGGMVSADDGMQAWAEMMANVLRMNDWMRDPLPAYCRPMTDSGEARAVARRNTHQFVNDRLDQEGDALKRHAPATARAIEQWRDWLNQRVADGTPHADDILICNEDSGEYIPLCYRIFAFSGITDFAEMRRAEAVYEDAMNSGGETAVHLLSNSDPSALKGAMTLIQSVHDLTSLLDRVQEARQADLGKV